MEIKEKLIKDSIIPISLFSQKVITKQMEKSVCKIHINGNNGTGFFAIIPYKNTEMKVLITNNHVLNGNDIDDNKEITFSINNKVKYIKIGKTRKKYTSEEFDTTIIEIKDDLDEIIDYLEIDNEFKNIIKSNDKTFSDELLNNLYKNESLYILNYMNGKDIVLSYGLLFKIDKSKIYHRCNTNNGSSGSPILTLNNNKLFGIHYGSHINFNWNLGTLIIYPLLEFQNIEINNQFKNSLNKMTIRYKVNEKCTKVRLFGSLFVQNNKDNCEIIVEGKTQKLSEFLNVSNNIKNILEIQLKETKAITNMSHMFCRGIETTDKMSLVSIPNISEWDTKNVTDMSYLFCCCEDLMSLPDISTWNTSKVKDMSNLISYCGNLVSLPDISKWDIKNVTNMSHMFCGNALLSHLPDISKWNTSNVKYMGHIFAYCHKLKSLPNISKWDISNVSDLSYMFSHCYSLEQLPDISEWNTKNARNIRGMFSYCYDLDFSCFPDISKWNSDYIDCVHYLFYHYSYSGGDIENIVEKLSSKFKIGKAWLHVWYNQLPKFNYKLEKFN